MSTTLGTINIVFQADVTKAVAGMGAVSTALDKTITNAVAKSNQFGNVVSGNLSASISATAGRLREFANSFSLISTAIGAFTLRSFVDTLAEYDRQLEGVRVLTRETTEEFKATRTAVLNLANTFQVSALTVAKGLNDIVQAGFTASDGLKVLEASIKAARVGMTTTDIAATALIQTLNAFSINAGDSEATVGKLVRAVDLGVFSFAKLSANIGQAAPLAATMGLRLEELLALFTSLTRKEANLDEVTTQVRATFSDLLAPSTLVRARMEAILGTTVEAAIKTNGFADTLKRLVDSTNGSAAALGQLFPNIRALAGVSKLTGDNFKEFTADIEKLDKSSVGSLNRALAVQSKSFGTLVDQIKATATNSLVEYFERNRASFITFADTVSRFVKDNPEFLVTIGKMALGLSALAVALGAVKLAAGGLSLTLGVLATAGSAIKAIFDGRAISSVTLFADRLGLLVARVQEFTGSASRIETVATTAANAQRAASIAAQALATAQENTRASTAAFNAALEASTKVSQSATAASRAMTEARIAERIAEDALTVARDRQLVAENRVAGLNLAASNRGANGRLKAVTPGAANLIPSAVRDLVSANNDLAAAEAALASATLAREAATAKAASTTTIATGESIALASASKLTTEASAELALAEAAVVKATDAEAAAMTRLVAATGSVEAAQRAMVGTTVATGTAAVAGTTRIGAMAAAVGVAVRSLGLMVAALAVAAAKIVAVGAVFFAIGYAIGTAITKVLEFFGIIDKKSDLASDKLLKLVDYQKKFYAEANEQAFTRRMAENEKAAANLAEKLQNLSDLARSANAGNEEAARKFKALNAEFERDTGQSGISKELERLAGQQREYGNEVRKAIAAQVEAGDQGVAGLVRIDEKTGEVIGSVANLKTILATTFGETKANELTEKLAQLQAQMRTITEASQKYANAVYDLRNGNADLRDIINETSRALGDFEPKLKSISEELTKAGRSSGQNAAEELKGKQAELRSQLEILERRRDKILEAGGGIAQGGTGADVKLLEIREQTKKINETLQEAERQYSKLIREEQLKRFEYVDNANDAIVESNIEALRISGQLLEAEQTAIELAHRKRLRQIEAERVARVKAAREAIGLTEQQRANLVAAIEEQIKLEINGANAVRDAKISAAVTAEVERARNTEEGREAARLQEENEKKAAALKEAGDLKEKARQAEINHEYEKRNDLVREYIKKLEEAGAIERAQLVREQEANRTAEQRLNLLRQEINARLRAGQGQGGVIEASRSAQSSLVGSSDVGGFVGGAQSRLRDFNSAAEARKFVDVVSTTLKTEYDALEKQRLEAIRNRDLKLAEEIAAKQKEVIVKFQVLIEALRQREAELRKPAPAATPTGTVIRKPKPTTATPPPSNRNPSHSGGDPNAPAPFGPGSLETSPLYDDDGGTPSDGGAAVEVPRAVESLSTASATLSQAVATASTASLKALSTASAKLEAVVGVLNQNTTKINEIDASVQRLRLVAVNVPE